MVLNMDDLLGRHPWKPSNCNVANTSSYKDLIDWSCLNPELVTYLSEFLFIE